jgi:membrane protein DedA with SNARE-associated domain
MQEIAGPQVPVTPWLVFGNVLLTQLGAPLPAIPTLVVAGAARATWATGPRRWSNGLAVVACLGGRPAVVLTRDGRYGYRVLNTLVPYLDGNRFLRAADRGRVHALGPAVALMFAKFIPGFATVRPPIAGALRLAACAFLGYSAIGAALWSGVARRGGRRLPRQIDRC